MPHRIGIALALAAVGCAGGGEPARPDPENPQVNRALALYEEARTATQRGDDARAASLLTDAIDAVPKFPQARAARAAIYDRRNETAAAEADYGRAIAEAAPHAALYYFLRARYHHRRRQFEAAEADYSAAVAIEARHPDDYHLEILLHRALLYVDTNRPDDALRDYEAALRLNPDPRTREQITEWMARARRR